MDSHILIRAQKDVDGGKVLDLSEFPSLARLNGKVSSGWFSLDHVFKSKVARSFGAKLSLVRWSE